MASIDGWAIMDARYGREELFYGTSRTRNGAICELLWNYYGPKVESQWPGTRSLRPKQKAAWDKLYREGYRAVPVVVTAA